MTCQTIASIAAELKEKEGIGRYYMGDLRDALGYGKLGVRMVREIERELQRAGIRHMPGELPHDSQERPVRLWLKDTPVDELINAVRRPSAANDRRLRRAVRALEDADVLKRVRELVCDDEWDG